MDGIEIVVGLRTVTSRRVIVVCAIVIKIIRLHLITAV